MAGAADSKADFSFGDYRVDRADERLWGPDGPVRLGNKAFRVLVMLAEQQGRLLTKEALFSSVWDGTIVSESALTSVIKELRRALGDESKTPRYIESVYGRGYRFLPEVREVESAARPAEAELPSPRHATASRLGQPPLLYIGPFDDATVRDSHPHLADVLREEILFALSRFRDIRLVSDPEAPATPRGGDYDERDYMLTVRLIGDGDSVRAFARLTRLSSGAIIWTDQVEVAGGRPGLIVEQLVRKVAAAALPRLHDDVLQNLPQEADDVYDLYFLHRLETRSLDNLADARRLAADWERLIEANPGFGLAYPPLIRLYNIDFGYTGLGSTGPDERARAYELAHRAVAIDPTEAHFHTVKGWCHLWAAEAPRAREHLQEALQLNPYNQGRLLEAATAYMFLDELDRAAELLERCRNLTPFATQAPHEDEGLLHLLRRDFDTASDRLSLSAHHSISCGLYALLAAAGARRAGVAEQARAWRARVAEKWAADEPLTDERLVAWVVYHHPFQEEARRAWVLELLDSAFRPAGGSPRSRGQAPRSTPSAPSRAASGEARPAPPQS